METKFLSREDGGMVAELVKKFGSVIFRCTCKQLIENPNFEGYTHEGGFADGTGTRWWMYVTCPACKFAWAVKKLDQRVKSLQSENHELGRYELFFRECELVHKTRLENGEPNIANSVCNLYTIDFTGRKVMTTPIVTIDHSPMNHVKEMVRRLNPACYVVVLDAWQSPTKPEDLIVGEDDPKRMEVLWIAGRSKEGGFAMTETWEVIRDLEGKVKKFENLKQTVISEKLP